MGCGSCGTTTGKPGGCKSNGTCGTSGCNKLNVYDWLSDVALPEDYTPFNIIENFIQVILLSSILIVDMI